MKRCIIKEKMYLYSQILPSAASVRKLTHVTDNLKHFKNVQSLVIENWVVR